MCVIFKDSSLVKNKWCKWENYFSNYAINVRYYNVWLFYEQYM